MGTEHQLANDGVVQPRDFYLPRLAMDVQDTFGRAWRSGHGWEVYRWQVRTVGYGITIAGD